MKRIFCIALLILMTAVMLCACAKDAMDDVESAVGDMSSKISSGMDDMMGGSSGISPTNPAIVSEETDNPTDGEFGEPNVNDYDDNDSDVVGDENEAE